MHALLKYERKSQRGGRGIFCVHLVHYIHVVQYIDKLRRHNKAGAALL